MTELLPGANQTMIQSLLRPEAFFHRADDLRLLETHVSWIILAGEHAYKIKKPLDLGFLDFSDPTKRAAAYEEELRLNRRLAPSTYRGIVSVVERDGEVYLHGAGRKVEPALWMRRLPADGMLPALLRKGTATPGLMRRIARTMARFHAAAATGPGIAEHGSLANITARWQGNFEQTASVVGRTLPDWQLERISRYVDSTIELEREVFAGRIAEGRIRDGHGDLHAGSICLDGRRLVIFDCLEFAPSFRCGDVAAEVAFLVMDLAHAGRADLGWTFASHYARVYGDRGLFDLLDFYACYRAYVRGKVVSLRLHQASDSENAERIAEEAGEYFDLATSYASERSRPTLLITCGLPGTGKSTLASALARRLGMIHLSTDVTRKLRAGVEPTTRPSATQLDALYSQRTTRETYAVLRRQAHRWLRRGCSVILDGTFNDPRERTLARNLARRTGSRFRLVQTLCSDDRVRARLIARAAQPSHISDADWDVFLHARAAFRPPDELPEAERIVDRTGGDDIGSVVRRLLR
jgi:uncharacterized protein